MFPCQAQHRAEPSLSREEQGQEQEEDEEEEGAVSNSHLP